MKNGLSTGVKAKPVNTDFRMVPSPSPLPVMMQAERAASARFSVRSSRSLLFYRSTAFSLFSERGVYEKERAAAPFAHRSGLKPALRADRSGLARGRTHGQFWQITFAVLLAVFSCVLRGRGSEFADAVVSYDPGIGYVIGFTNAEACLGEPSRINPFGEPTDPFDPPYGKQQIVSIGAGGSLTVYFETPLLNHPNNLYGLDFTIFGNCGFIITNDFDLTTYDWIGTPATDGSLFAQNTGLTRVWVSRDGLNYFVLNPNIAPQVDNLFPTDGAGDFHIPVTPNITQQDFAGLTLEEIRTVYQGSAGGASFDISWALDQTGQPVFLPEISFVRIEVLSGKAEVDGLTAVARNGRARGRH